MSTDRMRTELTSIPLLPVAGSCSGDPRGNENKGIIVYVRDEAEGRAALADFDRLDNPPDCCRLRYRLLSPDRPEEHPEIVTAVAAHTGSWPLPLTVVDGNAVVAGRLATQAELVRFTSGKTPGHAPGLMPV